MACSELPFHLSEAIALSNSGEALEGCGVAQGSTTNWWQTEDGRWWPPNDDGVYGIPHYRVPVIRDPDAPLGKVRNPWSVVGLSIVTLGIYLIYWQCVSFRDLRRFSGSGIGGGWAIALAIVLPIVNVFRLPLEIGKIFEDDGKDKPVETATGFWVILPLVGGIVWIILTQSAMNQLWNSWEEASLAARAGMI